MYCSIKLECKWRADENYCTVHDMSSRECPHGLKKYQVPVSWEMMGEIDIMAASVEDAILVSEHDYEIALPLREAEYIDGSWEVDHELAEDFAEEEEKNGTHRFPKKE